MAESMEQPTGGCTCGQVRYRVLSSPMIVHCCHCRWCQRQTGTAFALNALLEADQVQLEQGAVETIVLDSPSGRGQSVTRCGSCRVAVWSSYYMGGLQEHVRFLRVGTLDDPDLMPPDVHIYTTSKQPWLQLPENANAVAAFYRFDATWSAANLRRREALFEAAGIE